MLKTRFTKRGVTIVEMIVVFVIIATMLGLLLPALQFARDAARRTQCQSNLHQLDTAMHYFAEARGKPPSEATAGAMGGWAIEILPFLEDTALAQALAGSPPLTNPTALGLAGRRPAIMTCPSAYTGDSSIAGIPVSHYTAVFWRGAEAKRFGWLLGELPTNSGIPWVTSPGVRPGGPWSLMPHSGGYFEVHGGGRYSDGVQFRDGGPD